MSFDSTSSTPKRKRSDSTTFAPKDGTIQLITSIPGSVLAEEEVAPESPRTKVASRFEDLRIEGGEVGKLDLNRRSQLDGIVPEHIASRKRLRIIEDQEMEIPETPQQPVKVKQESTMPTAHDLPLQEKLDPVIFKPSSHSDHLLSGLSRAYPSINRLQDSKSRAKTRIGTPPPTTLEDEIIDPDQASLTWHDDEITGHDPDDPDDDGEGINGIGFKPTPAMARVRDERRKQQLAEYRNREAKEARAKRSEKRRGSLALTGSSSAESESARKVRFTEDTDTQPSLVA